MYSVRTCLVHTQKIPASQNEHTDYSLSPLSPASQISCHRLSKGGSASMGFHHHIAHPPSSNPNSSIMVPTSCCLLPHTVTCLSSPPEPPWTGVWCRVWQRLESDLLLPQPTHKSHFFMQAIVSTYLCSSGKTRFFYKDGGLTWRAGAPCVINTILVTCFWWLKSI